MEPTKVELEVRPFEWTQFNELCTFLAKWSPDHPELAHVFKWQECDRFVAMVDNEIVGYIAQIKHPFYYGKDKEGTEQLGFGATLVLKMDDDNIRKKAGRALLDKCENNGAKWAGTGMIPAIEKVYERRGHVIRRDCCNMYARFFNPKKCLEYIGTAEDVMYAWMIRAWNKIRKIPNDLYGIDTDPHCVGGIDGFDYINIDLAKQYAFYGDRTWQYLCYKISQPNKKYLWATSHLDRPDYIIYRESIHPKTGLKLVRICDIAANEYNKPRLISVAVKYAESIGADGVVAIDAQSDAKYYRRAGMWIKRAYPICMPRDIKEKVRITMFDSDLDNLW